MNKKSILAIIFVVFSAFSVFASGRSETSGGSEIREDIKVSVFVSVLPQTYFVEKIGGSRVDVDVMVLPGRSPATYEPTPNQMVQLGSADVFFTIGVPFERAFLPRVEASLGSLKIVHTEEGIVRRQIDEHHHEDEDDELHEHEAEEHHEDDHEHEGNDPHIWLSPVLAKVQARNIHAALVELDPEGRDVYDEGLEELIAELDDLDNKIKKELEPYKGRIFFIYHPALGYFADEYNLEQIAIETGGKEPSAAALGEIIEHAKEEGVKIIFVQPEFSIESAGIIADAIDGNVVTLNTLNPDYINNLSEISAKIRQSYE